ncbi:TonB family protein [Pseudoxanthomonas beigongshangi]
MSSDVLRLVLGTTLAASLVILLLQLLRALLRRWLGAGAAYATWACVPVAVIAVLLPAREVPVEWGAMGVVLQPMRAATAAVSSVQAPMWEMLLLAAWLGGMAAMMIGLWIQQRRFVRGLGELRRREDGLWIAETSRGLPAAIGLFRTRIVVPIDFDSRYDVRERRLIACHERLHVGRGDLVANAFVAALRCVYWFNPVIQLAARRFRFDQELACDAGVIRRHPGARRAYGGAMLKAQLEGTSIPVACHWPAPHPLRERIGMLGRKLPSARRRALAALLIAAMTAVVGYGAWAGNARSANEPDRRIDRSKLAPPRYPASRHEGKVVMRLDVGSDGRVTRVGLDRSSGFEDLDQAAMAAARGWYIEPAIEAGRAVASTVRVPVEFSLDEPQTIVRQDAHASGENMPNNPPTERR